jgi:hypothetical protein
VNQSSNADRTFGEMHFGNADLGNKKRTQRLVYSVDRICHHPGGSLPEKFKSPKDLKAFYRLCNCEAVTHEAILTSHRDCVLSQLDQSRRDTLVIHDSTELDYTKHFSLDESLGQIGSGNHRGYICHNSLAVDAKTREVQGLLNQVLHQRPNVPKNETQKQRRERQSRESRLWVTGAAAIPGNQQFIDVCDQGADTFEFLSAEVTSGRRFVIRAAYSRAILVGHDEKCGKRHYLRDYASRLPKLGEYTVEVTSRREEKEKDDKKIIHFRKARLARVCVAAAPVRILPPNKKSGEYSNHPLAVWVIRAWEPNPPKGQEPLEWFLLTNEPVTTFEQAIVVIQWYECRWIIEEYHKAQKTGCGIQNPQFTSEAALKPAIAILSVAAVTLLKLRDASRRKDAKKRLATDFVSIEYVKVLSVWRHERVCTDWSVHDFVYALARMGGHQNRKNDKPPGWLILWRGWKTLQAMMEGAQAIKTLKRSG